MDNVAAKVLLGTSFIYQFVKIFLPEEKMVVPKHSKPVAIIATYSDKISTVAGAKSDEEGDKSPSPLFLVARQVFGDPMLETRV